MDAENESRTESATAAKPRTPGPSPAYVIRTLEFTIFISVLGVLLGYLLYVTPELPQRLATHFDASGRPNGWSDRTTFAWLYGGTLALMGIIFGGLAVYVGKIPTSLWSFPNRDWWLSGERSNPTRRIIARWLLRFGSVVSLYLGVSLLQIVQANRSGTVHLSRNFWIALGLFLVYTAFESIRLMRRFRRVEPDSSR